MSQKSLREQILEYEPFLTSKAHKFLYNKDFVGDLVQETMYRAIKAADEGRFDGNNFAGWLHTILHNVFVNYYRDLVEHPVLYCDPIDFNTILDSLSPSTHCTPDAHLERVELQREIDRILNTLSAKEREAITLAYQFGYSYEEISKIQGIAIGTVKSRINRSRVRVKPRLGKVYREYYEVS